MALLWVWRRITWVQTTSTSLLPNGQFGTRLAGGKDSASERYIFTQLNPMTKTLFNPMDNNILKYLDDDGFPIEPVFYASIIPMVLVNGSKGIGTGFSTDIMCYNPKDIIAFLKQLHSGEGNLGLHWNLTIRVSKVKLLR